VISKASSRFWKAFEQLPPEVKARAKQAHTLWMNDSRHPSLQFKKIHDRSNVWCVRIDLNWRALCVRDGDEFVWFWIGTHADYERMLAQG
jgi:hypothetical protein